MYRTHNCGELREEHIDQTIKLSGWLDTIRDFGSVVFFTIRDFYGITQMVISDDATKNQVREIPRESTISVEGIVKKRTDPNNKIPTGQIEIHPSTITILGKCTEQLPFEISNSTESREDARLKHRFLDLRNPINKDKIILRSKVISAIRRKMTDRNFLEISTPILTSSSPEGARDYIVPSRVHPGRFYALPQAPQQFKQLLMVSGFDRYFQIAPCFRDEDARADRSPGEFYQLDLEMAFATQEDVFTEIEGVMSETFREFSDWTVKTPFQRIKYNDAMEKYGSDKPDLRNPLLITDVTEIFKSSTMSFFENKIIKAIAINNFDQTRRFLDDLSTKIKDNSGDGIYWFKLDDNGQPTGGIAKHISEEEKNLLMKELDVKAKGIIICVAGKKGIVEKSAGLLRTELGKSLDLIEKNIYRFCWIVDFPMYELNPDTNKIEFSHNPFSMPQGGLEALNTQNPLDILAYQYDIVCNGIELSSGAVRNHDINIMLKAFDIAGYNQDMIEKQFPALFNAFKYGAPPHAGIAPGIDRIVMLLADEPNIREIIAFPMNKSAQDLLMGAPGIVTKEQLDEVHIQIKEKKEKE